MTAAALGVKVTDIQAVWGALLVDGGRDAADEMFGVEAADIAAALERTGDVGLAADAILMRPRPEWLRALIGDALMWDAPA